MANQFQAGQTTTVDGRNAKILAINSVNGTATVSLGGTVIRVVPITSLGT